MTKLQRDADDLGFELPWQRDGGSSPGKRSMTQSLSPRPIIFRVESAEAARELGATFGHRDRNGVAEHAGAAVDRADGGNGSPLPGALRDRFESSLGADLSAVRVHTSDASVEASRAVGARAYAVGNDIHFNSGQYQPDDPFGMHLIAHEVAHTQQQASGAAHRQHKLEVSAPGDSAELEADRAADAMVSGRPAQVNGGAGIARAIMRKAEPAEGRTEVDPYRPMYPYDDSQVHEPPTADAKQGARTYYETLRTQNLEQVKRIDAELAAMPTHPPNQSSIFGPQVDATTRAERKAQLEADRKLFTDGNQQVASNLLLLDDPKPESQAKAVNRANSSKAVYTSSQPISAVKVLLGGGDKGSTTTVEAHETPAGVGTTTTTKKGTEVNLKEGSYTKSESTSTTVRDGSGSHTDAASSKTTVGLQGVSHTADDTTVVDGKLTKMTAGAALKRGDGRLGGEASLKYDRGTADEENNLKSGTSVGGSASGGLSSDKGSVSADAGMKGTATAQEVSTPAKDSIGAPTTKATVSVTPKLDGKVTLAIVRDKDGRYWANLTFSVSGGVGTAGGLQRDHAGKESASVGGTLEVRGNETRTIQFPIEEADVEAYKAEFASAAGGTQSSRPGLHYVSILKNQGDAALLAALDGASPGSAAANGQGFQRETGVGGSAGVDGKVQNPGAGPSSAGSLGVSAKVSTDRKVRYGFQPKLNDPQTLVVSIEVSTDVAVTGGPTVSSGFANGGATLSKKDGGGRVYKFEMANDPNLVAQLDKLDTVEEADAFVAANSRKLLEKGERDSSGSGFGGSAGVGPAGASMAWSGDQSKTVVRDENGQVIREDLSGSNNVSGGLTAGPVSVWNRTDTEALSGSVDVKNKTVDMNLSRTEQVSSASASTLYKNATEHTGATALGLATGSATPYTDTEVRYVSNTKITEAEVDIMRRAAEGDDESRWVKACFDTSMDDWMATRAKVRAAKGDKARIAEAMTEFMNSSKPGRKETVDNLVHSLSTGRRADWPKALAAHRATYESVTGPGVIGDVTATVGNGGIDKANAKIDLYRSQIAALLVVIKDNHEEFRDEGIRMEMNRSLSKRSSELAWLKTDLGKRARAQQQQKHDNVTSTQLAHGVDTDKSQCFNPVVDPQQSISDEDLYAPAPEAPATLTPEEEKKQALAAVRAQLHPLVASTQSNQKGERGTFAAVQTEYSTKKDNWLDKPDLGAMARKLNAVKEGYTEWDATVKSIEKIARDGGIDPATLDYRRPNREQWYEINGTIFPG